MPTQEGRASAKEAVTSVLLLTGISKSQEVHHCDAVYCD